MNITFINSDRPDIDAQLKKLESAFEGVENAKGEFKLLCDAVKSKRAGMYHLKGDGFDVQFVGCPVDDGYQLWALTGVGYIAAVKKILNIVEQRGYRFICGHSVKKGIPRMLKRFNADISMQQNETVHTLYFKEK